MLAVLSFLGLCAFARAQSGNPTATVQQGVVVGTTTSLPAATASVNKFLGIPFAQSPPLRFGPPQAPASFSEPMMVQALKPACIQQFVCRSTSIPRKQRAMAYTPDPELERNITMGVFNAPPPPAGESEDCLYINVFAPSSPAPPSGRSVMFWIYGGAFQFGTANIMAYDGSAFAAYHDVVLVTHNYRTNGIVASLGNVLIRRANRCRRSVRIPHLS